MAEEKRRALVTGGSRGIGRAIAKELAEELCNEVLISDIAFLNDNSEECASELKSELQNNEINIYAFKADASSFEDADETIKYAVEKMGGLDIVVNNAGITRDNLLLRMNEADFDSVININLKKCI